jgi:plasmid stabilization system protein ParE
MDCKVIWTDPAIEDLGEIVRYIAADDPSSARRVGNDIIRTVELLQSFPLLGPPYAPVRDGSVLASL